MTVRGLDPKALAVFLRVAVALCLAAPMIGQNEAEPYFSLSSNRTFGSADKPEIMLSGWQVSSLAIRVYRVKDPEKFVAGLEDSHNFGGRMPRPAGKRSLLERIHDWKRDMRRDIRLNLRGQFTESPRARLTGASEARSRLSPSATATKYADAPVLNSEQLVLSFSQPVAGKNRWGSEAVPVPVKEKGVFLVEAVHNQLRAYTILVVSDAVLITKSARGRVLSFLVDRATGEPIANTPIVAAARKSEYSRATTDSDGLAEMPVKQPFTAEDLRLVAVRGKDVALSTIGSWSLAGGHRNLTGVIYTDRPVYRPGDAMHFRGILRTPEAVGYRIPASTSVPVLITDPEGKTVYQTSLTTNSNGIIHDEFALPRGAALGAYYVQANSGEGSVTGNFEVQEYKKPEYEVRVTPERPRVLEGESISATIDARYYFGEPVNGAKVKYSIYRSRYFYPLWYEPDEETGGEKGGDAGADDAAGEQISESEGRLDADGKLTVSVPTTVSDHRIDYRYRIEAAVTDKAGREISGTGWLIATYGDFVLNVEPDRYFYQPGAPANFKVAARDYDNKPIATAVQFRIESWQWRDRKPGRVVGNADATTTAEGVAEASLTVPQSGDYYRIVAFARSGGRTVEASAYVWVAGPGEGFFYGGAQHTIQIVPDKKSYRPGETAKILIIAGQPNTPVLVSIEGRDIRSRKLVRSSGATAVFEYTVSPDDEPGFFVSAAFIRKGEMYQSQKRIKVPPEEHKLDVQISTDKATYLPGQLARYTIEARTTDGKPAAGADLSLGVVDEAIYAIRRDATPDLLQIFYGQEWNSVSTESSLSYFFSGEAGTRRMQLAALRPLSQLAQLKPERMVLPKVRKAFPDTAFWAQDLVTDSNGHAEARVEFPDSLTTWRATARGATPDGRFGSATQKTIVRKNLIVRLAVPRFFVQGDEVVLSAIVHNYLTTAKHARVSLKLSGLGFAGSSAVQEVDVPVRGETKVDWRVRAQAVRTAKITGQALTDEESDAIELDLPVNPPGVPVRQAKGGTIANSGTAGLSFTFPAEAVAGSRTLSIHMSSSIAGSLFSALDYLTSFPYGCVEQTMSSFLPDLIVTKAIGELGLKPPLDPAALSEKTQAGLDRLYSFQHEDGGWGWWQTDESHPFMTAYVVAGLSEAKKTGLAVKEDAITNGVSWLSKELANGKNEGPDLRAYIVYALVRAGHPNASELSRVYGDRSHLSPYGLALSGLAFEEMKDSRASELAGQIERTAKQSGEEAWWPAARDAMLDLEADVTPEASAYALKLLTHQLPKSALLPKAALWLVNHRDEGYWWSSSKQTAMVIYGLIDYVKVTRELHPNFNATVSVNGKEVTSHPFQSDSAPDAPEFVLDETRLQPGTNQIQVASNGEGRLYYSVSALHYSNAARLERQGAVSLNLLRDYFRLVPARDNGRIVYDLNPLEGSVTPGDTVAVRLTVTGTDWKYLLIEDPIPAGSEFIEKDNLYDIRSKPPWWRYWFTRRELHDDRMAIFQTFFNEGQQQYFYLLKVVNPGLFHLSPARVQPMYQPRIQATTEGRTLEAK